MTNEQMEKAIRDLQDAMVVQGQLEARLARGLHEAAAWLEAQEERLKEHEERREEEEAKQEAIRQAQEARNQAYEARMQRIETNLAEATDKLNALINFVATQHKFPEA